MLTHSVLIVDDHPVFRRGLRSMLAAEQWVEAIYESDTAADAVRLVNTEAVTLTVMDLGLPDEDGAEATRRILATRPEMVVLVITMDADQNSISRALHAGARGYALKETDPDTLVDALRTVAAGGVALGPRVGPEVLGRLQAAPVSLPPPLDQLTAREIEILRLVARGLTNRQVGRELHLSEKTVRNQLSTVFAKLQVTDRVRAALLARDHGLS